MSAVAENEVRPPSEAAGMMPAAATPVVEVRGVSKRFGGNRALEDVSLRALPGEVLALVGENGAGKSTLGKIIAGALTPDAGEVLVDGAPVGHWTPAAAMRGGVALIQQEIAVAPDLSVVDNVMLGTEDRRGGLLLGRRMRDRFRTLLDKTGFELPADARVGSLRLAQQQEVAILWALAREARLIVMDEPTAALAKPEAEKLLSVVRRLRQAGTAIVYVSHFLDEVLAVADTVAIMRNGRLVETLPSRRATAERLIVGMLGQRLETTFPERSRPPADAEVALSVDQLSQPGVLQGIDLEVRRGEIVGIFGLMGSGRSELAHALAGAAKGVTGTIRVGGQPLRARNPRDAIDAGVTLLPESRKDQGLFLLLSQRANVSAASLPAVGRFGVLRPRAERALADELLSSLDVQPHAPSLPVDALSGGNQQKVLFAKCLATRPQVLILDEPTRGVDVGSKRAIYRSIVELAAEGYAVLLISSEIEEVLHLPHRLLVMRGGAVVREYDPEAVDGDLVLQAAFGFAEEQDR
jgi:ABC-type sugar transport system ATPase subunit